MIQMMLRSQTMQKLLELVDSDARDFIQVGTTKSLVRKHFNFKFKFGVSLRPQTVASAASLSLRTLLILAGIVCSQNCYIC